MTLFGYDLSNHNATPSLDGWDFVIAKSTEGTGYKDWRFADHIAAAQKAGLLVAAYHYVRGGDVDGQLANIRSVVPLHIPVILDVEDGAGSIASVKALYRAVVAAGYSSPLIYLPRWYWQKIGSPDLTGLPPLWLSRYPDHTARARDVAYSMVGRQAPFGGITSAPLIQFTSSPLDQNAFEGTREQLAALLGGGDGDEVSGVEVWTTRLKSGLGYTATAEEWVTETSARAERIEVQLANLGGALSVGQTAILAALGSIPDVDDETGLTDEQVAELAARVGTQLTTTLPPAVVSAIGRAFAAADESAPAVEEG